MAWVRLKATSDGVIISKRRVNAAGSDGFSVPSMRKISSKFDTTFVMTPSGTRVTVTGPTALSLNKWYHLAVVAGPRSNYINLYLDGKLEISSSSTWNDQSLPGNFEYFIGKAITPCSTCYFNGDIDEVYVFNATK